MSLLPVLLLIVLAGSVLPAGDAAAQDNAAAPGTMLVAGLSLPPAAWPQRREEVAELLRQLHADVLVIDPVHSSGGKGPAACWLAIRLRMHCDFITADPPSHPRRAGVILLSPRPLLADGASLLHGNDDSPPVAAGYLRLDVDGQAVGLYTARLATGGGVRGRRARQARDLRLWMSSHDNDGRVLVVGHLGAGADELGQLLPGLRAVRPAAAAPSSVGGSDQPPAHLLYAPAYLQLLGSGQIVLPAVQSAGESPGSSPADAAVPLGSWARLAVTGAGGH